MVRVYHIIIILRRVVNFITAKFSYLLIEIRSRRPDATLYRHDEDGTKHVQSTHFISYIYIYLYILTDVRIS